MTVNSDYTAQKIAIKEEHPMYGPIWSAWSKIMRDSRYKQVRFGFGREGDEFSTTAQNKKSMKMKISHLAGDLTELDYLTHFQHLADEVL